MHTGVSKKNLRAEFLTLRRAMTAKQRRAESAAIQRHVMAHAWWREACTIISYYATEDEVDTRPLLRFAQEEGKTLVLPRMHNAHIMWHCVKDIHAPDAVLKGAFNLYEPPENAPLWHADSAQDHTCMWLIPGVAFTLSGIRLGHGRGYYDAALRAAGKPTRTAGLAFTQQICPTIPADSHDEPVHAVVTPTGWTMCHTADTALATEHSNDKRR